MGPIFTFPTATTIAAERGQWGLGLNLNQRAIQPVINYNLADGWALTTGPIISADWIRQLKFDFCAALSSGQAGKR